MNLQVLFDLKIFLVFYCKIYVIFNLLNYLSIIFLYNHIYIFTFREFFMENEVCPECHDTGIVKEKDGSVHTCFKCLVAGRLNQHSDKIEENKRIKL